MIQPQYVLFYRQLREALVADTLQSDPCAVVHIFCDDPDYLDHYSALWELERSSAQFPRVSFGPSFTGRFSSRAAAASQMTVPAPIRLTSVVDFAVEVCVMVHAAVFVGTTGSSVFDLVQGLRSGSPLAARDASCIGRWPVLGRVTNEASGHIQALARAYAKGRFNPDGIEILAEHRDVLDLLMPHALDAADGYLSRQLALTNGTGAMSVLGRGVLEAHPDLQSNRNLFRSTAPDSSSSKRWLTAMLSYRLNPYLAACGKPHTYTTDSKDITRTTVHQGIAPLPGAAPRPSAAPAASSSAGSTMPVPGGVLRSTPEGSRLVPERKRPRVVPPPAQAGTAPSTPASSQGAAEVRPLMASKPKALPRPSSA